MNIDELINFDHSLILDLTRTDFDNIVNKISTCDFQETMLSVVNIMANIDFMKNGVFSLVKTEDIYSSEILYRCIIEHYIKQEYLVLKYLTTRNNSVGIEYKYFSDIGEQFDFINSVNKQNKLFNKEEVEYDFNEVLSLRYPEYRNLSKQKVREIKNQFSINNLIKVICELSKNISNISEMKDFILDYSILSSFVHGGQNAINAMLSFSQNENQKQKEKYKIVRQAMNISYLSRFNVLILSSNFYKDSKKVMLLMKEQIGKIEP